MCAPPWGGRINGAPARRIELRRGREGTHGSGVSFITLGVADLARSMAFYERLGWTASPASQDSASFSI
jgi:hypothetical protein